MSLACATSIKAQRPSGAHVVSSALLLAHLLFLAPGFREDATGRKGIGFKSVFGFSRNPHILSGDFKFMFDLDAGYVLRTHGISVCFILSGLFASLGGLECISPSNLSAEQLSLLPTELLQKAALGWTCIFLPLQPFGNFSLDFASLQASLPSETLIFLRRIRRMELVPTHSHIRLVFLVPEETLLRVQVCDTSSCVSELRLSGQSSDASVSRCVATIRLTTTQDGEATVP